ncbi:hypothetical protein D9619_008290 [Psilocybe cf. subviscida]|uniref:Uncharacterized protein n=1 Tax=Psilocybe cf. subviscida TaxID=2480587 RepID=A0A8H5F0I1_9AGAR|nr:hypothetical protein D9619_008290 [Psilocybe cf. subviscida]
MTSCIKEDTAKWNDLPETHERYKPSIKSSKKRIEIFHLTKEALRHMPNLKEFRFEPFPVDFQRLQFSFHTMHWLLLSSDPDYRYPFQLEILEWEYAGTTGEDNLIRSQSTLRHLDVSAFLGTKRPIDDIPLVVPLSVVSIRGGLGELSLLAADREIVAFDYCDDLFDDCVREIPDKSQLPDALAWLRYIRASSLESFVDLLRHAQAPSVYQIVILQLSLWCMQDLQKFHLLPPTLEVIVLREWDATVDPKTERSHDVARTVFSALPGLIYLYICSDPADDNMVDAWRLSWSADGDEMCIHDEVVCYRDASGDDLWRMHLDALENMGRSYLRVRDIQ